MELAKTEKGAFVQNIWALVVDCVLYMNQIAAAGRSAHFPSFKMPCPASGVQKKEGDFGY